MSSVNFYVVTLEQLGVAETRVRFDHKLPALIFHWAAKRCRYFSSHFYDAPAWFARSGPEAVPKQTVFVKRTWRGA